MNNFDVKLYKRFFSKDGILNFKGILAQLREDFESQETGVYHARSLDEILSSRFLNGCHEWGMLWMHLLEYFHIDCSYVQCVNGDWLNNHSESWKEGNWQGHVFVKMKFDENEITICSTSARVIEKIEDRDGFRFYDGCFIELFEGRGPSDFQACTQAGVNKLLEPLIKKWDETNRP